MTTQAPPLAAYRLLQTLFVVAPVLFGLDKFVDLLLLGGHGDIALRDFGLLVAALALAQLAPAFTKKRA